MKIWNAIKEDSRNLFRRENLSLIIIQIIILLYMMFDALGLFVDKVRPRSIQVVEGYSLSFLEQFFGLGVVLGIAGYIFLWRYVSRFRVEKIFLFLALFFGSFYMFVMPVYSAPDENSHVPTVYYYSNQLLGKQAVDEEGNVMWREGDDVVLNHVRDQYPTARTYATLYHHFWDKSTSDRMVSSDINGLEPMKVTFLGYVPQILGITIARIFNFGTVRMFLLGKLFILLFYTAIVYKSIEILPVGKEMLATVALLPISLIQASSYSYDGVVTSVCFLFISVVLRIIYEDKIVKKSELIVLGVLMIFMASIKVVYVMIGIIIFAIPTDRFSKRHGKWVVGIVLLTIGAISVLFTRFSQVMELSTVSTEGYMGLQTYSISVFLNEPIRIVYIVYSTIRNGTSAYLVSLLGERMGWYYVTLPDILQYGFAFALIFASLQRNNEGKVLFKRGKYCFALAALLCAVAIEAAMLFAYTPYGENYIQGVQGRYFLPILPLLLILIKSDRIIVEKEFKINLGMMIYILQYFSLLFTSTYIIESVKGL